MSRSAAALLEARVRESLQEGWRWSRPRLLTDDQGPWGISAEARLGEALHRALLPLARRPSLLSFVDAADAPLLIWPNAELEAAIAARDRPFRRAVPFQDRVEYRLIADYYRSRRAERSGLPYQNHIDEGLGVLRALGAREASMAAFCLHPLLQSDRDFSHNAQRIAAAGVEPYALLLAVEYRSVANATLSRAHIDEPEDIRLSPLDDVNMLLRADKVQNAKDFLKAHAESHPRAAALDRYFRLWLERLGIDEERFDELRGLIEQPEALGRALLEAPM